MVPEKARAEVFRYDAAGNLHEADSGAEARKYGRGNRLLRKGETEYRWDDDGRLVEKRTLDPGSGKMAIWRYSWDGAGLMRSAEGPDGIRVDFTYDPFARRVLKRVTKPSPTRKERALLSVTRFVWDGEVLVHEIEEAYRDSADPSRGGAHLPLRGSTASPRWPIGKCGATTWAVQAAGSTM